MQIPEIEIKILEINRKEIENTLKELGAQVIFDGTMKVSYFDFDDEQLAKSNKLLRLRIENEETVLVFKHITTREDIRNNVETSVNVSDYYSITEILKDLGLKEKYTNEKHRIEFKYEEIKIAIDTYRSNLSHIPTFMEIEGNDEQEVRSFAYSLGFPSKDYLNWTTKELIEHYKPADKS